MQKRKSRSKNRLLLHYKDKILIFSIQQYSETSVIIITEKLNNQVVVKSNKNETIDNAAKFIRYENQPFSAWRPLKSHTYLNKPADESWRFV